MIYPPSNWSNASVQAFDALIEAINDYNLYDYAIGKLNITDAKLLQARTDLGNNILNNLGPAFRATLP